MAQAPSEASAWLYTAKHTPVRRWPPRLSSDNISLLVDSDKRWREHRRCRGLRPIEGDGCRTLTSRTCAFDILKLDGHPLIREPLDRRRGSAGGKRSRHPWARNASASNTWS